MPAQVEQLHALVVQLTASLSPDQAAFIHSGQEPRGAAAAGPAPCFGAGLKFRLETVRPSDEELAYLSQPVPQSRRSHLTFDLDAVQAVAAAAAAPRQADEVGVDWLEKLVVSFYGDEKPLGNKRT